MDKFKFKKLIESHSKEIEKGLLEVENIKDIDEKGRKISLLWWEYSQKQKKLLEKRPESVLRFYDPDLVKYEKLIEKLWKLNCEISEEVIKQRENKRKSSNKEKENKIDLSKNQKNKSKNNICWECHKTNSEKWYINQENGLEFCSRACNLEHNAELCENCVQKCLKYENGIPVDYQTYYKDNEKKTGILCFSCKQKQRKELESELDRLEKDQETDKEELERIKNLIENNSSSNVKDDISSKETNKHTHTEGERERESKINLNNHNYNPKYKN